MSEGRVERRLAAIMGLGVAGEIAALIDTALIVTATVRRSGRMVGVVDVDVADEAGRLLAIRRATYATAAL
jgi:hypothetical protein